MQKILLILIGFILTFAATLAAQTPSAKVTLEELLGGEEGGRPIAVEEDGRDHGDVGQVRAAGVRRVQHVEIAGAKR